jgi:hypothetical protein
MAMIDFPFAVTCMHAPQFAEEAHDDPEKAVPYIPDGSV